MKLLQYLDSLLQPDQSDFAKRCGTSIGNLRKALSTGQRFGVPLCVALERESNQVVTRKELRPDDW
jgi:DNA-binding transcriptional regulator YdaS (Cro superfamily)